MSNPELHDDEVDLIELAVIWLENIKIGIVAALLVAALGSAYMFYLPKTLIITSNIVIGTQINGSSAIGSNKLAQLLTTRYNVDNKFSDSKQTLPFLSKVSAHKNANILQLSVTAANKASGGALLQNIINDILSTYNTVLDQQREQAKQSIVTLQKYIQQVNSNPDLKQNVSLSPTYEAISRIEMQLADSKSTTTIPALPEFYSKSAKNLKIIAVIIALLCVLVLMVIPLCVGLARQAAHRFKEIRKQRSAL